MEEFSKDKKQENDMAYLRPECSKAREIRRHGSSNPYRYRKDRPIFKDAFYLIYWSLQLA